MGGSEILDRMRAERDQSRAEQSANTAYVLETYGMDECEDGDILAWQKQFWDGGKVYSYVATRGGGMWYLTGQEKKWTWVDLVLEIERDNILPIGIYKVSEVEPLFVEEDDAE